MKVINGVLLEVCDEDITEDGRFEFPEGVKAIGKNAFQNCDYLFSINIPEGVFYIDERAFAGCSNLSSITIANSVNFIEDYAFYGCDMSSINIPGGVSDMGTHVFTSCYKLSSINFPEGVVYHPTRDNACIEAETQQQYDKILNLLPKNIRVAIKNEQKNYTKQLEKLLALHNRGKNYLPQQVTHNEIVKQQLIELVRKYNIPSFMKNEVFQKFGMNPQVVVKPDSRPVFGKLNFFKEQTFTIEDVRACKIQLDGLTRKIEKKIMPDLDEANQFLANLVLLRGRIEANTHAFIEKGIHMDFLTTLNDSISKLRDIISIAARMNHIGKELDSINLGNYQRDTLDKSYGFKRHCDRAGSLVKSWKSGEQTVYPLIYEAGLRATIAMPVTVDSDPVELEITFMGTVDFASKFVDLDEGGPGQVVIRQHEIKLLEQVNHVMEQVAKKYPDKTFRLRISGHSLGGALAKGFAHSMQRACAVLQDEPDKIIDKIKSEWVQSEYKNPDVGFDDLQEQLNDDAAKFNNFKALNKISGVTVYALGAPGVSETTDRHGTLLTYYHDPDFLRMYHHHHREDTMVKFGDSEFLSGNNGVPRAIVNKEIIYDIPITPLDEENTVILPFPNITKRVMAAHNMNIKGATVAGVEINELEHSQEILNKFVFLSIQRFFYVVAFTFAKFAASFEAIVRLFPELKSLPVYDVDKPAL